MLLFASALSWAWTTLALLLRSPNAAMSIGFVILFAVTFLSNIFVQPATMPVWLHRVAAANPVSHLVIAGRGLMDGSANARQLLRVLAAGVLLAVWRSSGCSHPFAGCTGLGVRSVSHW